MCYNMFMKKLFTGIVVGIGLLFGVLFTVPKIADPIENLTGGLNLPDRCQEYTQIASRSTKNLIKAAPTKIFSFSVTSSASQTTYFQLYDRSNTTLPGVGLATPSFAIPIPARTAAEVPAQVDYDFAAPLNLAVSGSWFGISNNYANYSRTGFNIRANDFVVEICFE